MIIRRTVLTAVALMTMASLVMPSGPASADSIIRIDFERYEPLTALPISQEGVSFRPGSGLVVGFVVPDGPSGNLLFMMGEMAGAWLTVAVEPGASAVSFDYLVFPFQTTTVLFYHAGALVHSAVLSSTWDPLPFEPLAWSSFSYQGMFDTLVFRVELPRDQTEVQQLDDIGAVLLDNVTVTLDEGAPAPLQPPDDRLNWGTCDLDAVIYQRMGPDGGPALHVYGVDGESKGYFLLDVTGPDLAPYLANPPQGQNVLIEESGHVQLYALISGEFSLHIHFDDQGNVCAWVFDGLPPVNTHVVNYNMYQ